jgi:hypothetical protein
MTKKIETIDLKGKAYATVPTRVKEFRQDCPNGLIEPKPTFLADGQVMFSVRILKDKANPNSGESTGHAIAVMKGDKSFEKLETIATGRALALLGYMASGEIASSDEMEEFLGYKEMEKAKKIAELKSQVDEIKDLKVLRDFYALNKGLGAELDSYITNKSKELKNANS